MQLDCCLPPNTKLHSGWVMDPNTKPKDIGASRMGGQTFPIRSQMSTISGLKDTVPPLCLWCKSGHTQPMKKNEAMFQ